MNWNDMKPVQFDRKLAPDSKTRAFVATSADTMFPDLLPEVQPQPAGKPDPKAMDGDVPLFGLDGDR